MCFRCKVLVTDCKLRASSYNKSYFIINKIVQRITRMKKNYHERSIIYIIILYYFIYFKKVEFFGL